MHLSGKVPPLYEVKSDVCLDTMPCDPDVESAEALQ